MKRIFEIISAISGKNCDQLSLHTDLRSLGIISSIQILRIQSALERKFNQKLPPIGDTWIIHKIAVQVGVIGAGDANLIVVTADKTEISQTTAPYNPQVSSNLPNSSGLFIGVDIEEVNHLPETFNYRSHDFYQSLFSVEEVSYALLKPEPRLHLCGIFCAKEALKKTAPELIQLRMDEIQVFHRQGRPWITTVHDSINTGFNFQVSISHSNHYAVATVLAIAR